MSFSTTQPVAERRTQTERRWGYLIFRAGISLALLYSIHLVTVQAIAGWHLNRGSPEEIRKATERSEEHTSELQSRPHLVCRLLLEKKTRCRQPVAPARTAAEHCGIATTSRGSSHAQAH